MKCKHRKIEGITTKYFYCGIKDKAINEYVDCKDCPLKIPDTSVNDFLKEIFGKGFMNQDYKQ